MRVTPGGPGQAPTRNDAQIAADLSSVAVRNPANTVAETAGRRALSLPSDPIRQ